MACWSKYVTHLKLVANDKHAIKNFDRELACVLEDYSAAAGLEAVIPPKCGAETPPQACHTRPTAHGMQCGLNDHIDIRTHLHHWGRCKAWQACS